MAVPTVTVNRHGKAWVHRASPTRLRTAKATAFATVIACAVIASTTLHRCCHCHWSCSVLSLLCRLDTCISSDFAFECRKLEPRVLSAILEFAILPGSSLYRSEACSSCSQDFVRGMIKELNGLCTTDVTARLGFEPHACGGDLPIPALPRQWPTRAPGRQCVSKRCAASLPSLQPTHCTLECSFARASLSPRPRLLGAILGYVILQWSLYLL